MRCLLVLGTSVVCVGLAAGCAPKGVLVELPDPVFRTVRRAPREPAPAPVSVARPKPAAPTFDAEPGWMRPGGISSRWTCVVIHHSAGEVGGAEAFDRHHRNVRKWDELGYHFVIGNGSNTADGQIEVGSRWTKQKHGAHCKTPDNYYNDHGIGICLVGNFNHHPPTPAQMASLARLTAFLMRECGLGISRIRTHGGITHRTECPGSQFSLGELKARLDSNLTAVNHAP